MRTILVPIGPPGSGKSTLTNGLQQFMTAIDRPCSVVNLDPANDNIPYEPAFDVRDLVDVDEVMEREGLGPNGGVLWAMEEIEANFDWLNDQITACPSDTIVLDPPGQPELMQHHETLPRILERLEKLSYRIVIVQLLDSVVLTRPINVLTKIDNLKSVGGGELPFNLDFYTEMQDLSRLLPALSMEQGSGSSEAAEKWESLNEALISLIEDFGLVAFETLAVEDRQSMASLVQAIDRASGYVFMGARAADENGRTLDDEASIWAQAMSDSWAGRLDVRDVQERWIDRKDEFDEQERKQWEEEARLAGALPEVSAAQAVRKHAEEAGAEYVEDEDEDELESEQRKWQEERMKGGGQGGVDGLKIVRKT
ncbi:hypothetical protein LTR78_010550 [Recurvomyces mirabilis]|uniref:GPN-loop GTPase 2 n=1 Tax=Recurvomyces mirabilis TaxID=574656 RepID=A0AAE0WHX4_9PEZI|nr:hypothetical protein LTR78_010550 [Recurvomyces mirabilis]KAK5160806.1 hypothetical protein LTS14_001819 [Recurvomyces mirabilis]